jgi:hypothetical protein
MKTDLQPTPTQSLFLNTDIYELLLLGPRGAGLTSALAMDFTRHVGQGYGANWQGILFTRGRPDPTLWQELLPGARLEAWQDWWVWPTGECLRVRCFPDDDEYWRYHGQSFQWIGWDDLHQYRSLLNYERMFSTSRSLDWATEPRVRATAHLPVTEPIKDRWALTADSTRNEVVTVNEDRAFIWAS